MSRARVFPRQARSILTRTGGYLAGFTHTLQPYAGCEFSCVYCYVREMAVQRANPYGLPWSAWIAPKLNAVELLERAAQRGVLRAARIFLSSTTDPYTPLERELRITRGCLEVLARHAPAALLVQTRSPLVRRDVDLLARIPCAVVSVTVTTDDETVRRALEPDSPSIAKRLDTLRYLRSEGIRTQAALSPLLPCDPERFARAVDAVADRVVVDDFFLGDGAGGRRSVRALERLRAQGFPEWARPGYSRHTVEVFERILGAERVGVSAAGFVAAIERLEAAPTAV
jgi:DNA repair photolyase